MDCGILGGADALGVLRAWGAETGTDSRKLESREPDVASNLI